MTSSNSPDQLDSDIYPSGPLEHAVPEPLPLIEFESWHLPRKQWVRRHQWAASTKRLLKELQLVDRPLRYLGLPGAELLDIEVLAEVCTAAKANLRYLGFNTGAQHPKKRTTQQLAEDALKSFSMVDPNSFVIPDDILSLSSKNSIATRKMREFESFDVINLDLCDVFTTTQAKPVHMAAKNILEFQTNSRTQPWLLFVTTAIDRPAIAEEDIRKYGDIFSKNARQSVEFRNSLAVIMHQLEEADAFQFDFDQFSSATGSCFGQLLAVALGKWIFSVIQKPSPWMVELKSCACYRRGLKKIKIGGSNLVPEPDLFSLVFGINRVSHQLTDPTNLAGTAGQIVNQDLELMELSAAIQMVRKAEKPIDLDYLMQDRPDDHKAMMNESSKMLELRNYDATKYREWATVLPQLPNK